MSENIKIADGDYVVMRDRWRCQAVQAIRVTPQMVFYREPGLSRECRVRIQDVVFSGQKEVAERLASELRHSYDHCTSERTRAERERQERDEKLIAYARREQPQAQEK